MNRSASQVDSGYESERASDVVARLVAICAPEICGEEATPDVLATDAEEEIPGALAIDGEEILCVLVIDGAEILFEREETCVWVILVEREEIGVASVSKHHVRPGLCDAASECDRHRE